MSAFRGKADMPQWSCPLLRSLLGVKRTWAVAVQMSAYDPKRTSMAFRCAGFYRYDNLGGVMIFPMDPARVGPCSIILVHGTWGRGFFPKISDLKRRYLFRGSKRWFEDDSSFRARLNSALENASLGLPIRAFLWSGANSVHARDDAARELSDQLRKDLADSVATVVIIAHSHGGNVALRAVQHLNSMAGRVR